MADEKTIYKMKTPDGDPVRVEEAWKDANGELLTEKVNKADAQTITGLKTFATLPQSSATPSDDKDLATKKYSDDSWATRKAQEEKCYQALKTVTKDFTRTDPVHVRIGEDGEPEIHYTMTQANGASYFANMDLGNATLVLHSAVTITSIGSMFAYFSAKRISGSVAMRLTSWNNPPFNGISKYIDMSNLSIDLTGSTTISYMFGNFQNNVALPKLTNIGSLSAQNLFAYSWALSSVPAYDFSNVTALDGAFQDAKAVSSMKATGIAVSFSLTHTALKHDAILEVFNNLGSGVAEGTTLTLGATKLALMSDEEKKIATDKGWTLA